MRKLPSPLSGIKGPFGEGKPPLRSLAQFTSGPTIYEVDQGWDLEYGAEFIRVNSYPTVIAPTVIFGGEEIIITE